MTRGEIWWATLPRPIGSVPGKRRPVLIIQNDQINKSAINTVVVAAISSNLELGRLPGNLVLEKDTSKLDRTSVVNFSQIITVDKTWLTESVAMLPGNAIKLVDSKLEFVLGID